MDLVVQEVAILPLTLLNRGIFADLPWISKK